MQLADAAEAIANDAGLQAYFVYYGRMERGDVPEDVTHVRIHSSVRAIKGVAFNYRRQLRIVILNEELEEIGVRAFEDCTSIEQIDIPDNVRAIKTQAFNNCTGLTRVLTLGSGLEEIGAFAFGYCTTMEEIVIPNAVRAIKREAFYYCTELTRVTLGSGLEEIGKGAFEYCESMEEIVIPPAVRDIHDTAFEKCTNLSRVKFCDEIEKFVSSDAMRKWWNRGVGKKSLCTYCFLVRCDIPARFAGISKISRWQATIHDMLRIIPAIAAVDDDDNIDDGDDDDDDSDADNDNINEESMNAHFDAIYARLTMNENLLNEAPTLFPDHLGLDEGSVLTVLSFL
jgi:hypothetical protein